METFHLSITLSVVGCGSALLGTEGGTQLLHQGGCEVHTPITQQLCGCPKNCYEALIEHFRDSLGSLILHHHHQGIPHEMVHHHEDILHHGGACSAPSWTLYWCSLGAPTPMGHMPGLDKGETQAPLPQMLGSMDIPSLSHGNPQPS